MDRKEDMDREQRIREQLLLEENGGCIEPFVGCGIPGCLLPIVGVVAALTVFVSSLVF